MGKKRKIIGRNRKLNIDELFHQNNRLDQTLADRKIREAFPDPKKRATYIKALLHGLITEPIQEN